MNIKKLALLSWCLLFLSAVQAADQCKAAYQPAMIKLQEIEAELNTVNGKKMYQESVMKRYDALEKIIASISHCDSSKLSLQEQNNIQQNRMTLTSLQASAQASAFTEFSDWLQAKRSDLKLCQRITDALTAD